VLSALVAQSKFKFKKGISNLVLYYLLVFFFFLEPSMNGQMANTLFFFRMSVSPLCWILIDRLDAFAA